MLLTPIGFFYGSRLTQLTVVDRTFIASYPSSTAPVDIQQGDLLVFIDERTTALDGNNSRIPSGFELVYARSQAVGNSSASSRVRISQKIAAGTEGGMTLNGMDWGDKTCLVFRGNQAIKTSTPADWGGSGSSSSGTSNRTITPASGENPLLIIGFACRYLASGSVSVSPTPTYSYSEHPSELIGITVQLRSSELVPVTTTATSSSGTYSGRHVVAGKLLLGIK